MARPKIAFDQVRGSPLGIRLTAAERTELDEAAALYGLTAADYVRRRALGHRMPATKAQERSQALLATALIRLGVNLNQLVRHANAGRAPADDAVLELAGRINTALDRLYDHGGGLGGPEL